MGISLEVKDLEKARQIIEQGLGRRFEPHEGMEGRSIRVPASLAHEVYLEFFERVTQEDPRTRLR